LNGSFGSILFMEDVPDYSIFNTLCEALHRNDPHCTEVAVIWDCDRYENGDRDDFCPVGYGLSLGRALNGNEFVQTIELQLGCLLPYPIMDHINDGDANGVLDFLRNSSTLTTVQLRTSGTMDGDREICDGETLLVRYAVMAVAENPHGPIALHLDHVVVEEGSYPVDVPPDTLASALRTTKSIEELIVWMGDGGSPGFYFGEEYEGCISDEYEEKRKIIGRTSVAEAFRDNCSLKRVHILLDSDAHAIALLIEALRSNGSLLSVEYEDFTETQRDCVQFYCNRNQHIYDVLAELSESELEAKRVDRSKVDWLPIMPMFFSVVQHSRRMAASQLLRGLLGLAEELGLKGRPSSKRTRIQR
jgi:hypothetical protein